MNLQDANTHLARFSPDGSTPGQQLFKGSRIYSFVKKGGSFTNSTVDELWAAVNAVTGGDDVWAKSIKPVLSAGEVSSVLGDVAEWMKHFKLTRLDVGVGQDGSEIDFVSFDLACSLNKDLFGGKLQLTTGIFQIATGQGWWNAALVIEGKLFGMTCEAVIAAPSLEIEIRSADAITTKLKDVLATAGSDWLPDLFADAGIDSFRAVANVTGEAFSISLRTSDLIQLQQFDMVGAEINFVYRAAGGSDFDATAILNVGGAGVELKIDYDTGSKTVLSGSANVACDLNLADFVTSVAASLGEPVSSIHDVPDLRIQSIAVRLEKSHSGSSFTAGCAGTLKFDETGSSLSFDVEVSKSTGALDVALIIGDQRMNLDSSAGCSAFSCDTAFSLSLSHLARLLRIDWLDDSSFDLSVDVKGMFLAAGQKPTGGTRPLLFGIRFDVNAKLDNPVLDILTGGSGGVGLQDVTLLVANQLWTGADLGKIPGDKGGIDLPTEMPKGPHVQATLGIGGSSLTAPLAPPSDPSSAASSSSEPTSAGVLLSSTPPPTGVTSDSAHWFNVQKKIGPLYLRRVGLELDRNGGAPRLGVLVDGSCTVAVLTLGLQGLEISVPIKSPFTPEFSLRGLELDYQSGPVSIGGGLLHVTDHGSDLYVGDAHITTATFNLIASGEYGTFTDGGGSSHTTLFIFAVLNYPLGGPAFAFVTGLAAGFGYNSHLRIPATLDDLTKFPLIAGCQPNQTTFAPGAGTQDVLTKFTSWITPRTDQIWLAAGVMFRSFQMIETLALLTVEFGKEFQVALFGRSQMTIPPNAPEKLAYAELDVMATFDPQAGALQVLGVLSPNSWVIAPECHLTGGFAFCLWESGKFVVTYGGYHPRFNYAGMGFPAVPRLQLYWQIDTHTQVKGSEYFALTGGVMMAGGGLEATWESGIFSASFTLTADFLMEWRPFHFEADLSMSIAVEFTLKIVFISTHFSFHLGVAVHLEGPPLHGTAEVDLSVVSFTVTFGNSKQETAALEWGDFLKLLPGYDPALDNNFVAPKVKVLAGMVENHGNRNDDSQLGAINPKQLLIDIETVVPVNVLKVSGGAKGLVPGATEDSAWATIGAIGPMNASVTDSTLELKLEKWDNGGFAECTDGQLTFVPAPTPREAPSALWSKPPENSDDRANKINTPSIENVLMVVRIKPSTPSIDATKPVDVKVLLVDDDPLNDRKIPFFGFPASVSTVTAGALATQLLAAAGTRKSIADDLRKAGWALDNDDLGATDAANITAGAFWEPPPWMTLC